MSEADYRDIFIRVERVISIYQVDPGFFPRSQDFEDLNPTRDSLKRKIYAIEACVDWRCRASRCWWTQRDFLVNRILRPDQLWKVRRYLTREEHYRFWHYYNERHWHPVTGRAIAKIHRNMIAENVFWE